MKPASFFHRRFLSASSPLRSFLLAVVVGCGWFNGGRVWAQVTAQDDAANAAYAGGWGTGTNGGSGFGPWVLADNNLPASNAYSGFFIGDSGVGSVNVSNKSFGLYANGTGYNDAVAYRSFSSALATNQVLTFKFKHGGIDNDGVAGFSLRSGANFSQTNDIDTLVANSRFSFFFIGGYIHYSIYDFNFSFDSGIPWTDGGLTIEFAVRTADTYRLVVKNADGTVTLATFDGLPLLGSGPIDSIACYNLDSGATDYHNVYFNQFKIQSTSLVPPEILNVQPTNGAFYLPTSTAITFNALSAFSGIAANTNSIKVALNGTNVPGANLNFTGASTNWAVTASPALAVNTTYNALITVTDLSGNQVTNSFTFNTWSSTNLFIEAEAYNYAGGGAILSPSLGAYDNQIAIAAVSNIDFFEYSDGGANLYRTNDAVDLEVSGDSADHADYQLNSLTNWASPVILMERDASPFATTTNQPRASLGTFVGNNIGDIVTTYAFVPLKDFFGSNVVVRFAQLTNTFRLTRIGDPYNLDYLLFVPVSNTATQRPYISAGYPFPGAGGVMPDQSISFTIANRQTTNVVASTKLYVNGADVSGSLVFSNNAAGTVVTYTPAALYPLNASATVRAVFTDTAGVIQTNDWQFNVANILVVSPAYALASGSGVNSGFNLHLVKYPDTWPGNATPAPLSSGWAEAVLAGNIVNTNTGLPYPADLNTNFAEPNFINYQLCGVPSPDGYTFTNPVAFPNVPLGGYSPCANTNGPGSFALSAVMYVQLNAGLHQWAVRSDDGFRLAVGNAPVPTNTLIMDWEGGRGAQTPSVFYFVTQTNGLYPMRLLYYQGGFGASVELYSTDRATGESILINDLGNANSIKAYRATTAAGAGVILLNPQHSGSTGTFSFVTQAGKTHTVQYKNALTDASWQQLTVVAGSGAGTNITDNTASGGTRFYRVSTQ
ncbi:MAG: Ig-like domain-containing protein [Verrucomicrobia bacterium]|nr:Ig-like domain-containing protein [Verrucomicrobiota bacterium]